MPGLNKVGLLLTTIIITFSGCQYIMQQHNNNDIFDNATIITFAKEKVNSAPFNEDYKIITVAPVAAVKQKVISHKTPIIKRKLSLREKGKLILKDNVSLLNDEVATFMIFDSLISVQRSTRNYYFYVFENIMEHADSNLSKAIGDYALTYIETYPNDFLNNSKAFTTQRLQNWANHIGLMLFRLPGDPLNTYMASSNMLKSNCKQCSTEELSRIHNFDNLVWERLRNKNSVVKN